MYSACNSGCYNLHYGHTVICCPIILESRPEDMEKRTPTHCGQRRLFETGPPTTPVARPPLSLTGGGGGGGVVGEQHAEGGGCSFLCLFVPPPLSPPPLPPLIYYY